MASKTGLRVLALPLTKPVYGLPSFVYYHVQSPPEPPGKTPSWYSKMMEKGSAQWIAWSKEPQTSWKYKLHAWGERSMNSVEYEETSLKAVNTSFKPGAPNPQYDLLKLHPNAPFIYPHIKSSSDNPFDTWKNFLNERQAMHRQYFYRWMIGLPITAPLAIIPNVPFYYCAWRSWAHWKAWRGCQHLNELLNMQYFITSIEPELTRIYELPSSSVSQEPKLSVSSSVTNDLSNDSKPSSATPTDGTSTTAVTNPDNEIDSQLLLHPDRVPNLISAFNLSSLAAAEILTAIEQAKSRIKKERKKQKS